MIPAAKLALGDSAPFGPSETACRWCPISGNCKAQLDAVLAADFGTEPDLAAENRRLATLPQKR